MNLTIQIGNLEIPSYGLMIVIGVISANLLAIPILKKYKLDSNDFIILEAYTFLGAFIGAKSLYLWVSRSIIEWSRFFELDYFNQLMQGGFVFYGGLIGGIGFALLAGKIHHINTKAYIEKVIFLIPWIHCFGRIGCYLAGCCYGKPYDGIFAVTYPSGSLAPSGVKLFPVQLFEAFWVLIIAIVIIILQIKKEFSYTIEFYFIAYGILRFALEYFRYDDIRGGMLGFSTSQWISMFLVGCAIIIIILKFKKKKGATEI